MAKNGQSGYVCFANAHMLSEAERSPAFLEVINQADMVSQDGMPVVWVLRLAYGIRQERLCGMDLMPEILAMAAREGLSVYFYGSTTEVMEAISRRLARELPSLVIAGMYCPPFEDLSPEKMAADAARIRASGAKLLMVALGCPKQETWMHRQKGQIPACMLGLGQSFRIYARLEKRLPKPLRNLGLEWAYRLAIEPGRLWKRYLFTNLHFVWLAIRFLCSAPRKKY